MLQVQAQLGSVSQTVDGGVRFSVRTQEINSEEKLKLLECAGHTGWILWKQDESEFSAEDVPKEQTEINQKSTSQRLRSVLFILWKQSYQNKEKDFDVWYRRYMNALIDSIKAKLE